MHVKGIVLLMLLFLVPSFIAADGLRLDLSDIKITQDTEGGFSLRIRKTPDINSILITESTRDPSLQAAAYGLRNPEYHPVNGNEQRILDGAFLQSEYARYFLLDSSPSPDSVLGAAFHIFIPYVVEYGYPWSRNGELLMHDGTFLNIRTFEKPFADYTGAFVDNPFVIRVVQADPRDTPATLDRSEIPQNNYLADTVEIFQNIARESNGKTIYSDGEDNLIDRIEEILQDQQGRALDLVLVLDTTRSMVNEIISVKQLLTPLLRKYKGTFQRFRVGLVLYRDYNDPDYLTRVINFQPNIDDIQRDLDNIVVDGGNDTPEAVYEALYDAIRMFPWQAASRQVILIGDAPPHARPRGDIDADTVFQAAHSLGVQINTIILPQ